MWLAVKRFGSLAVVGKGGQGRSRAEVDHSLVDGRERQDEYGLVGRGVTEEFCMKVLNLEILNSRNLFNYFSRVVPRTIEFVMPVTLSPGRFKNWFQYGPFKNDDTRSSSQNLGLLGAGGFLPTLYTDFRRPYRED